jgi:hypothetical protein
VTKLAHEGDVPVEVAIPIDVLDEEAALPTAIAALANDAEQRRRMSAAAQAWWTAHHQLSAMGDAYHRVMAEARERPLPHTALPRHLRTDGTEVVTRLLAPFGLASDTVGL